MYFDVGHIYHYDGYVWVAENEETLFRIYKSCAYREECDYQKFKLAKKAPNIEFKVLLKHWRTVSEVVDSNITLDMSQVIGRPVYEPEQLVKVYKNFLDKVFRKELSE